MKFTKFKLNLTGDISGGVSSALLALPGSMAYGGLVFSPLGAEYINLGIISGLIAYIMINLTTSFFGGVKILNSGPFSLSSFMLASSMATIMAMMKSGPVTDIDKILTPFFLLVFLAGLIQALFGVFKLGELTKYIPHPVLSGLFNGTAILIFIEQISPMLGVQKLKSLKDLISYSPEFQPLTLFVGMITTLTIWHGDKVVKKIPPPFLGILTGTLVYHSLAPFAVKGSMGSLLGSVPFSIPKPAYLFKMIGSITQGNPSDFVLLSYRLLPLAIGLAAILSMRTLIASVAADNLTNVNSNTNRELIAQGVGNIVASIFGGISSAGSVSRTMGNYQYGGRTTLSRFISGVTVLLTLLLLAPVIMYIPNVVLSGMLVYLSLYMFDKWSFRLIPQILHEKGSLRRESIINLATVIFVTVIMVFIGIFEAVASGFALSILLFLARMGRNIIRREYDASRVRSNVERPQNEINILEEQGHRILVFELEGSLFFGTADKVSRLISESIKGAAEYIILDFAYISDIDINGINIVKKIKSICDCNDKFFYLSSLGDKILRPELKEIQKYCFKDLDDALAWAEDELIGKYLPDEINFREIDLGEVDALTSLAKDELTVLGGYLRRIDYQGGEMVFKEGDSGDMIYFIVNGRAHVLKKIDSGPEQRRLSTLSKGTLFGEMSIIGKRPRFADVVAEKKLTCYALEEKKMSDLIRNNPEIASKILIGIGRELSKRVWIVNNTVSELKK